MTVRIALALVVLLTAAGSAAGAENPWLGRRVLHMAHQGGERESPSNTLFAYERALAAGADMLEMDVNITKDGVPVVMHDTHLGRLCARDVNVVDVTVAQLKSYDAACTWPEYKGIATGQKTPPPGFTAADFQVPTLEEVLRRYPDVLLNIEIKGAAPDTTDAAAFWQNAAAGKRTIFDNAAAMAAVLTKYRRFGDAVVVSFSDAALQRFRLDAPAVNTAAGLLTTAAFYATTGAGTPLPGAPNPQIVALQPPTFFAGIEVPTADFVADAHARGLAVHVWAASEADETAARYRALIANGIDGFMTDYPTRFEAALRPEERYVSAGERAARARARARTRAARRAR